MRVNIERHRGSAPQTIRLTGHIASSGGDRDVWFELPDDLEGDLSETGEPWLLLMLPYAAKSGEGIELELPVDPLFRENARALLRTWSHWYPDLRDVEIHVPTAPASSTRGLAAQFFSGGVDSWFTLLRHTEDSNLFPRIGTVDELITVWGFDIGIDRPEEFAQLEHVARTVGDRYGKRSISVATNLRTGMSGPWKDVWGPRWGPLTHGTALAAVAHLLNRRYSSVKIASTHRFWEPFAYGSHPLTDPLFSTSRTAFMHDHALYSRSEKIERIAESDFALSQLKVCYVEGKFENCSACVKCHRMLLCFDALGILDKAKSFDLDIYRQNRHRRFLISNDNDLVRAIEVRDLAAKCDRADIVDIVERSIADSRKVRMVGKALRRISWRLSNRAYRGMVGNMIGA